MLGAQRWVPVGMIAVRVCFGPATTHAQGPLRTPVVQFPASVRFAGLNGAGAALVGHASAVFTNPAGLATISHLAVEGGYQTVPNDGYVGHAAVAWRIRQFDLGFGWQVHAFGDGAGVPDRAFEGIGVGSLVYRFGLIALGASGKLARRGIGDVNEAGASMDLGMAIAIFDIMALGLSLQNVGGNWRDSSPIAMPTMTRAGFTMNYVDPQGSFRLLSTVEMQWPGGEGNRLVLGGEGGLVIGQVGVVGRLAYGSRPDTSSRPKITFGATVELRWVDVDLAREANPLTQLTTNRIGARLAL